MNTPIFDNKKAANLAVSGSELNLAVPIFPVRLQTSIFGVMVFTSVFGMGTGVTPALLPPGNFVKFLYIS